MSTIKRNIQQLVDAIYVEGEGGEYHGCSREEIAGLWQRFDERSRKSIGFSPLDYNKPDNVKWSEYITHILRMCHAAEGIHSLMEETKGEFTPDRIMGALTPEASPVHAVVLRLVPMLLLAFKDMGLEVLRHKLSDWDGEDGSLWGGGVFDDVSDCVDGAYERLFAAAIASGYDVPVPEHMESLAAEAREVFKEWGGASDVPSEELN
jgi:hypothetical protein